MIVKHGAKNPGSGAYSAALDALAYRRALRKIRRELVKHHGKCPGCMPSVYAIDRALSRRSKA
jgi:hypothetical protein